MLHPLPRELRPECGRDSPCCMNHFGTHKACGSQSLAAARCPVVLSHVTMIEGYAPFELGKRAPAVRMRLWICGPLCCGGREARVTNLTILLCCSYSCTRLQYTVLCGTAVTQASQFGFGAQNQCPINRLVRAMGAVLRGVDRLTRLGVTTLYGSTPPSPNQISPKRCRGKWYVATHAGRDNISYTAVHLVQTLQRK